MTTNQDRPLITFILFAFNQEEYVTDALKGALSQTYSPLEIIVSDDCSSDQTFSIAERIAADYKGPHQIILNRNEPNLGVARHINKVMELAKGELILMAAADDISFPERAEVVYEEWLASGKKYKSIFSNVDLIDESGNENGKMFNTVPSYSKNIQDFISTPNQLFKRNRVPRCWVLGCSQVIHRSLFDVYGPLDEGIIQEDGAISFRALLQGEIKYIDQPLVKYRRHSTNAFQPDNLNRVLRLLKSEYYYKKSWLKDALLTNSQDEKLIQVLNSEHRKALLLHRIYHIPFLGMGLLHIKKIAKYIIRFRFNKNRNKNTPI